MCSDLTFGPSFKVKRWFTGFDELSFRWIQIYIGSLMRRSSLSTNILDAYIPYKTVGLQFLKCKVNYLNTFRKDQCYHYGKIDKIMKGLIIIVSHT